MASKKRSLPQVEDDWNGYESLMNVKPKERYDIKASIFDLNTIRDSALFEKERFSLCLSPPKEKPGTFKFSKSPTSPKSKIPNDSAPPKQLVQQPNLDNIGNGGGINKIKKDLPPSIQNQQTHQYNTRKVPTSMVPQQQQQQQFQLQQQQQQQPPKISQQHQQYLTKLTNVSNSPIKSLSQLPNSPLRKRFSSTSQPSVVVQSSSSINTQQPPIKKLATNNNGVNQTNTITPPHTLQNRPATPTRTTNPVLNNKPSTPIKSLTNKPLTPSKQPLLTTNDLNNNITTTTATATAIGKLTTSSHTKNTNNNIINGLTTTTIDQSRLESRIKSLEIENKIINSKLEEKDQIIETLSGRVSELEFQLVNFMLEVKTCILEKDK
ncbi:hypothetical protein DDB_G0287115 [Dictyostelium discoideum AX4]|uniref:Uncharacterized protein n=1 Tax=Dictyostelium discoideum TaxID=44689 RepID=Q54KW2_DICDI|nr:hypothetical protein DDB_G0287115 [Dictyostelium discoideum AX4]EAL63922.1 hypothetical protein DDB_G0287115 [Dictyostelium discoideum AX4]|eukprot:XP_637408.1 hypothetical protein DDB_G0287115 [Dictyostelium discoideum AX4]